MCDVYISLHERVSTKFHERLPNFVGSLSCIMKYGIWLGPPFSAFSVVEMSDVMRISISFPWKSRHKCSLVQTGFNDFLLALCRW